MAKIKYMGSADIREIKKGTDAGGQLQEKLPVDLTWDRDNNWVIDTSDDKYSGVAQEFWALLLEGDSGKEFKDVSDLARIPTNQHQQIFLGMPKSKESDEGDAADDEQARKEAQAADDNANPAGSEASGGGTTTTVGGSTTGDGGTASGGRTKGGARGSAT